MGHAPALAAWWENRVRECESMQEKRRPAAVVQRIRVLPHPVSVKPACGFQISAVDTLFFIVMFSARFAGSRERFVDPANAVRQI